MRTLSAEQATRDKIAGLHSGGSKESDARGVWAKLGAPSALSPLMHAALAGLSYTLAVVAVSSDRGNVWTFQVLRQTLGLVVAVRLALVFSFRPHRISLQHAGAVDAVALVKSAIATSVVSWALIWWQFRYLRIPLAAFVVDATFLVLLWSAAHLGARALTQRANARKVGRRVVIVGAGDAGVTVLRELTLDGSSSCNPVAIVDDDRRKWGRSIYGLRVAGGIRGLAKIAADARANEILICIPSASRRQMRDILCACRDANLPARTLPAISELVGGTVTRRDLRRPQIEDLLQRHEVEIDTRATRKVAGGKTVLVTGAGGSIGSELCRQIAEAGPRKLLLLDRSENSLFYVDLQLRERLGPARVRPLLVDLLHRRRLREIMWAERPDIVFHAAAHKHVGLLEVHPAEAIRNNVVGTRNLAEAAIESGTERLINISTDKAVNPKNYMGLSKKLTELCIQELARRTGAKFSNVRFGNVAGSTGSVLRLFWDQIQAGKPIRVTDPHATRFFMTISEAVHLILQAGALGRGGETFVFDMGEPLNIYDLARTMMLFNGLKPDEDLRIEFTGLKPGEKTHEELWDSREVPVSTGYERVFAIRENNAPAGSILAKIRQMEELLDREDHEALLKLIDEVVPEFRANAPADRRFPHPAFSAISCAASPTESASRVQA